MRRRTRRAVKGRPALPADEYTDVRQGVLARDGYRCLNPLCRRDSGLQVDHVIPRSQGGPDDPANLASLCGYCNAKKERGTLLVIPNGDGTFRFHDLVRTVTCESCFRAILQGERAWVPTPAGNLRCVEIGSGRTVQGEDRHGSGDAAVRQGGAAVLEGRDRA